MNGGVNGTMENSIETSISNPELNEKEVSSEECYPLKSDKGDTVEGNENLESEPNENSSSNNRDKDDESRGDHQTDKLDENGLQVSKQENCSNDLIDNHSSHSNESYPESLASSQGKSDSTEQQATHSINEQSKDRDSDKNYNKTVNAHEEETHEIESEDSSDEYGSVLSEGPRAEDTVSINSDSDEGEESSQDGQTKSNDVIILETDNRSESQNGNSQGSTSPEVQEVPSDDDCVLTNDEKSNSSSTDKHPLRRSSRGVKRKNYDLENGDDESDVEEVELEDPLSRRSKAIVINDTKTLVEMAAKKKKMNQNSQKKEPTIVIIDTNSGKSSSTQVKNVTTNSISNNPQSLYQSIIARGTTVTPISSKSSCNSQSSPQNTQAAILPSLTDDMFVVEAPSFIVPYVYEKPSVKPFREFVDTLGKELEDERVKEEKARLEKQTQEKEVKNKLRNERKERGEEVSASEDESEKTEAAEKKKKKAERKAKRCGVDEDDPLWDGETSSDTEDETLSDEDAEIIKDKADSIEEIKDITDLTVCNGKSDNYFDCSLGKFFVNIGLSLVQEYVQSDLLKQQNRKLYREKKSGHNTKETQSAIASLTKNLEFSKENNAPFSYTQKKCEFCSFKTESELVLNHHLETPHMKNNVYKCNFCEYEIRSPHDILIHMETVHKIRGKLERAPAYHQCSNCPFEDNGKGKLARHQIACAKKFKPDLNLAPPIEWEPPAKIPKIARARNNMMGSYQNSFNRQMSNNMVRTPINIATVMAGASGGYRPRGRSPLAGPARAGTVHGAAAARSALGRPNAPSAMLSNVYPLNNGKSKSIHQPSISITPLPRQPQPSVAQPTSQSKNTFVICEICDGYIKDLEQLRNHMQWIHKVKIHPKMIYNRPPLNCQKCQFRFFTDQGLERHLLGSHGLVTSSMQEAANKGNDAGRCPVCGRVYQWKLLNHVARVHNLTLKPAHLSYKCTVCTATFGMYKQFENHVYSAHSVVAKRVMDKNKASVPAARPSGDSLLKPLKINDEITIIPQPIKPATSTKTK